jgi:hypothetical protein
MAKANTKRLDYAPQLVLTRMREGWVMRKGDGTGGDGRAWLDSPDHAFVKYINPRTFRLLLNRGLIVCDENSKSLAVSRWKLADAPTARK